jgi:phosphoribosyl-ATP pyrophosphohydrolase/phosphoribosyl-AMP cyclohydrolase
MAAVKKETLDLANIKYGADGLIPVVVQEITSGEVLRQIHSNEEALEKTLSTGYAHYYSRSKKSVFKFGETMKNTQKVVAAFLDNDKDSLLLKVRQNNVADIENNQFSCFNQQIKGTKRDIGGEMHGKLQRIIDECRKVPEEGSYANYLLIRGVDKIGKKVGEEAVELVIAAKNGDKEEIVDEAADFLYHMMVLLHATDVDITAVAAELCKRNC